MTNELNHFFTNESMFCYDNPCNTKYKNKIFKKTFWFVQDWHKQTYIHNYYTEQIIPNVSQHFQKSKHNHDRLLKILCYATSFYNCFHLIAFKVIAMLLFLFRVLKLVKRSSTILNREKIYRIYILTIHNTECTAPPFKKK